MDYAVSGSGANPADAADFGDESQSNKDFLSGVIHFGPGECQAQIVIPIHGDTLAEAQEQFTVTLSNPSPEMAIGGATADVLICNDDWNILPQTTSNGEEPKLVFRRLVNYGSPGWRYQQVEIGGLKGFERGPEPRGFATGRAGFGDYAEEGLQCNSAWSLDTDMLLRRNVNLRPGEWLGIAVAIDNDVEVWVNGVEVSGGMMQSEYMAVHDRFMFAVPADVVHPGSNLVAIRARDRGCANFIDARIIAISDGSPPPPAPSSPETPPPVDSLALSGAALIPVDDSDFEEDSSSDDSNWIQTGALLNLTDDAEPTEFNQPTEAETIGPDLNEFADEPIVAESDSTNNSPLEEEAFLTTDGWLDVV